MTSEKYLCAGTGENPTCVFPLFQLSPKFTPLWRFGMSFRGLLAPMPLGRFLGKLLRFATGHEQVHARSAKTFDLSATITLPAFSFSENRRLLHGAQRRLLLSFSKESGGSKTCALRWIEKYALFHHSNIDGSVFFCHGQSRTPVPTIDRKIRFISPQQYRW